MHSRKAAMPEMRGSHFCRGTGHPDRLVVGAVAFLGRYVSARTASPILNACHLVTDLSNLQDDSLLPMYRSNLSVPSSRAETWSTTFQDDLSIPFSRADISSPKLRDTCGSHPPGLTLGYRPFKATCRTHL